MKIVSFTNGKQCFFICQTVSISWCSFNHYVYLTVVSFKIQQNEQMVFEMLTPANNKNVKGSLMLSSSITAIKLITMLEYFKKTKNE